MDIDGYDDWRLPSIKEAKLINKMKNKIRLFNNRRFFWCHEPLFRDNNTPSTPVFRFSDTPNVELNVRNNDYFNPELRLILEDLHDENVLTQNGILYFIDTVFYITD